MIYRTINLIFDVISLLILIRVILSWIRPYPSHPSIRFVYEVTEPILEPIRQILSRLIPSYRTSPIDFSPVIAIFLLRLIRNIIIDIVF
ncbi:MAG: YggT family protein [Thermosediminibacterales bacterium]|nr:YggT family protein [Thermosediminibacterales bacterium]